MKTHEEERREFLGTYVGELELSVRAHNALMRAGITTYEQFRDLTREDALAMKNAGLKTWREINDTQLWLSGDTRPEMTRDEAIEDLKDAVRLVNTRLQGMDGYVRMTVDPDRGLIVWRLA